MPIPLPDSGRALSHQNPEVLLAMLVFGEARGESMLAKLSVAYVVLNRWYSGRFGKTLASVILAPNQFACFNPKEPNHTKMYHPLLHELQPVWNQCYVAAMKARLGIEADPTKGALFYHDDRHSHPPADWGSVEQTAEFGRLRFYRPKSFQTD